MPNLPPPVWAELSYSGAWNDVTDDVRVTTSAVTVARGLTSESASDASPTACACDLDSRGYKYAPRAPQSALYGLIGRNTPFRWGYTVGAPWAELPGGLTYNSLFVNDVAALDVTGDFDLRLDVALEDWSQSQMLALRYVTGGDNRSWALEILDGILTFLWSPNGTLASRIDQSATEAIKAYNGQRLALRVTLDIDNGSGGYELRFYTGRTVDDTEWNLLGAPIVGGSTTSVFAGAAYMEIGAGFDFNSTPAGSALNRMHGKAYALKLLDGIGGTVKVDMNTRNATAGGTTFVDDTGLTWSRGGGSVLTNKHIRMSGEVPAWPPTRDLSGNDNYVSINPSGVTRRMDAGNKPVDSALLRFIRANNPIECWPLTDGIESTGGASLVGGRDMTHYLTLGTETPVWRGGKLQEWIEDVIAFKAETAGQISGGVPNSTSAAAAWSVDFFVGGGGAGTAATMEINDRGAGTDADNRYRMQLSLDAVDNDITIFRNSFGETSSSSSLLTSITSVGIYDGRAHHIRVSIDPGASSTDWAVYVDGVQRASGTLAGIVFKAVRDVRFNWSLISGGGIGTADQQLGYITYWDGTGPSAANMYDAFAGFQGERAGDRILRLAAEAGYTASVAGESVFQQRMGIQGSKKLLELMNEAARTNFGYLLDARDRTEVIHRGQSTLWNQPPALTLDFSAGLISAPFRPVDDDKLTENDVSVKREYGSVPAREVLEEGPMSVLDPEDGGVGRYDKAYTYSVETDAQARQVAGMRVHLGTYAGVRYTRITLNLANERVYALIDDILRVDVGDKIRLTDLPDDHGPDDVDVLVAGYTEEAGPDAWLITFVCVPGEPWMAAVVGSDTYNPADIYSHADTGGCELAEALDATETAIDVTTTGLARWVDSVSYLTDFPFDVRTGDEVMRVLMAGPILNSNPTFQTGVSGWTATNATLTADTTTSPDGSGHAAKLTSSAGATPRAASALCPVVVGQSYAAVGWLMAPVTLPSAAGININWRDAGGVLLSTSAGSVTLTAGVWTPVSNSFTAPASAVNAEVVIVIGGTPGAGYVLYAKNVALVDNALVDSLSQTLHVVRSVNGVSKAHSIGQDIRLAHPVYAAM